MVRLDFEAARDVVSEHRRTRAELRKTIEETVKLRQDVRQCRERATPEAALPAFAPLLLVMAEGLIAAHKAAKIDSDGYTLDLIEDALAHVGRRLSRETASAIEGARRHGADQRHER